MAEYIPMRKPGKLTVKEAREKLRDGKPHVMRETMELTGMTRDEVDDEEMREGGWTDDMIREFHEFAGM